MKTEKKRIPGQSIRNTWQINPRTRIHDNDIRKNKTKERQLTKKEIQNEIRSNQKASPKQDWLFIYSKKYINYPGQLIANIPRYLIDQNGKFRHIKLKEVFYAGNRNKRSKISKLY